MTDSDVQLPQNSSIITPFVVYDTMYRKHETLWLPVPREELWAFFSDPANLAVLTPPEMRLELIGEAPAKMHAGLDITYRVRPILGIPLTWKARIVDYVDGHYFIDEQVSGPYAHWRHEHRFEPDGNGTRCIDNIEYKMPFGILGKLGAPMVKAQIDGLFQHRAQVMNERFANTRD